jgi:hypothetical protein
MCLGDFFRAVLFLAVNPRPHFVELQAFGFQVAKYLILIDSADLANF